MSRQPKSQNDKTENDAEPVTSRSGLQASLSLYADQQQPFSHSQVDLLKAVSECGSISKAAKQVGISYKTAWDRIDAMNNMSAQPLVVRSTGGAHGGGTSLTEFGKKIVEGFQALQKEHEEFVQRLGRKLHSINDIASFMRSGSVKTSARNQYRGVVTRITPGAVNTEVELRISDSQNLVVMITQDSVEALGLQIGHQVMALVKASWILISKDIHVATSARNKLIGKVARIETGAVNGDVVIDLGEGKSVSANITNTSIAELGLAVGDTACALFKASSVILVAD
ncbi:molybdenum-dependent transcriptional regulator [Hahella sp. CCB-MM4]|uniref:TOBE domain-containing protein n=1 Tax=Hahella sp. (strain CCB-MM4) TaxID=1926491 RepID=UPI000B9A679E|nr:TOBE domain-containing protein [Hahella sp. CCB-MM4]OZG69792.1 molybdenum-dependent transcriptional regulator [Hahella sp. CCB-MM4]